MLGTLSADEHPQFTCDLLFEDDFEVSHSSKTTSVFLVGYMVPDPNFEYPFHMLCGFQFSYICLR